MENQAKLKLSCARCGFVSTEPGGFIAVRRWPGPAHASYCRRCWRARFTRKNNRVILSIALALVVGVGVLALTPRAPATETLIGLAWLEVNIAILLLLWPLFVGLHELAHALAAKAVGMRLFRINVGFGRTLLRIKAAGIDLSINALLFLGGLTYAGHLSPRFLRARQAAYIAAGPAANLVLAGILVFASGRAGLGEDLARLVQGPAILQSMLLINLVMAAASLFPARVNTAAGIHSTDGMKLLGLLKQKPDLVETSLLNQWIAASSFALQDEDFTLAEQLAAKGLERKPDHYPLLNNLGIAKLGKHDYEAGRDIFVKVLDMHETSSQPGNALRIAESFNNIAYADLSIGGAERLCEAEDYSRRACELVPREPGYEETRGCVLVELRRYEEGRRLLARSTSHVTGVQAGAIHHAYLALAHARLGNAAASAEHLRKAQSGPSDHPLLRRILARISEPDTLEAPIPAEQAAEAAQAGQTLESSPPVRKASIGVVLLGFLIAPLASGVIQGVVMRNVAAGIMVLYFAYPLALIGGVPGYLIFRRLGWLKAWQVILAGAGLGVAAAFMLAWGLSASILNMAILLYLAIFIAHGASVATVFWWIAIRAPRAVQMVEE